MAETSSSPRSLGAGKLQRSPSSRLRMHAPSSIQVAPPSTCISKWKVAIPLLSPLDISSLPRPGDHQTVEIELGAGEEPQQEQHEIPSEEEKKGGLRRSAWQHPAEPFYYEPVPSTAPPAFVAPYCA